MAFFGVNVKIVRDLASEQRRLRIPIDTSVEYRANTSMHTTASYDPRTDERSPTVNFSRSEDTCARLARSLAASIILAEKSMASTRAPLRASGTAREPVPQPASSIERVSNFCGESNHATTVSITSRWPRRIAFRKPSHASSP